MAMNHYKMVFLDMDGTLLDPAHQLAKETIAAVKQLSGHGIPVVLATARPYYGAYFFRDALGLTTPLVAFNGALIVDIEGEKMVDYLVDEMQAVQVVDQVQQHDCNLLFLDAAQSYALRHDAFVALENELTRANAIISPFEMILKDWEKRGIKGGNKLMAVGTPDRIQQLEKSLKANLNLDLTINTSHPSYLEITHQSASKKQAVATLHQHFKIRREEVVAIGDSYNDLDMLRYAGLGVAMGNAEPLIKEAADWVTRSNEQHGVAHALKAVFNL